MSKGSSGVASSITSAGVWLSLRCMRRRVVEWVTLRSDHDLCAPIALGCRCTCTCATVWHAVWCLLRAAAISSFQQRKRETFLATWLIPNPHQLKGINVGREQQAANPGTLRSTFDRTRGPKAAWSVRVTCRAPHRAAARPAIPVPVPKSKTFVPTTR